MVRQTLAPCRLTAPAIRLVLALALSTIGGCAPRHFPNVRPLPARLPFTVAQVRAENYFISALDYERRGLLHMAERFYEMAHELDPESPVLCDRLVNIYLQLSKYPQALVLIKGRRAQDELPPEKKRQLAKVYFRMGQLQRSADLFEEVPGKTTEELYTLGMLYEMMGKPERAVASYLRCYSASPEPLPIGLKLGSLYLKAGDTMRAESLFCTLDRHFENQPEILNGLALANLLKGDTLRALDFLALATGTDSLYADAIRLAAQIHLQRGDYKRAIPCYERLHGTAEFGDIYGKTLAILYYYDGKTDSAISLLTKLLKTNINDHELHFHLGLALAAENRDDPAQTELEKAIALEPDFIEAWRQLCFLLARKQRWDESIGVARRFASAASGKSVAWRTLGGVYNLKKDYEQAATALLKAVRLDSSDAHAWFELGSALERQKKTDEASHHFRKALQINPGDAAAANYLGYMWAEEGRFLDSAKTLLELAVGKEPENGAYLDSYAWVFYQLGDYEQAHVYIRKALKRIDGDPVVYEHLGEILAKRGDRTGAAKAFSRSLELGPEKPDAIREKLRLIKRGSAPPGSADVKRTGEAR